MLRTCFLLIATEDLLHCSLPIHTCIKIRYTRELCNVLPCQQCLWWHWSFIHVNYNCCMTFHKSNIPYINFKMSFVTYTHFWYHNFNKMHNRMYLYSAAIFQRPHGSFTQQQVMLQTDQLWTMLQCVLTTTNWNRFKLFLTSISNLLHNTVHVGIETSDMFIFSGYSLLVKWRF